MIKFLLAIVVILLCLILNETKQTNAALDSVNEKLAAIRSKN